MLNPQYKHQIKKGTTVHYGKRAYPVQQDRKYLHIVVHEEGKRRKINVDDIQEGFWPPGTKEDYIFNGWFEYYSEKEFLSFAAAELKWVK